jgi:glycerophosphoryl diester phosphodiesterase family protein
MLSVVRARAIALFILTVTFVIAFTAASFASSEAQQSASLGLERAHAHNDYEHERPLFDALDHNFKSVEADIWLVNGELIIAHDPEDVPQAVQEGRTLRSLYLDPLQTVVTQNGGSVYPGDPDYFTLLIDIKSEAASTYLALHEELEGYGGILTKFGPRSVRDGAVTAIVSGNRPRELMQQQRVRYAAYDGRLSDLGVATDQTFVPLISDNWTRNFTWTGDGPMPSKERKKLRSIVETAHANGQRVRFWATPEQSPQREAVWEELLAARVDYINTDHLDALQEFLLHNDPNPTVPYVSWGD